MSEETTEITTTKKPTTDPELRAVLEKLLDKFDGNTETVATRLIKQNIDLGTKLSLAETKANTAESRAAAAEDKASKAIPDGHVTLPKADADALAAYKALGDPAQLKASLDALEAYKPLGEPAKVKESLDRLPVIEQTLAERDRDAELATVVEKTGYAMPVLKRLVTEGMTFTPKTIKHRGEDVETFDVTDIDPATGKERTRPLSDVESTDWKDVLTSLKPAVDPNATRQPLPRGGSPYRSETRHTPPPQSEERSRRQPIEANDNRRLAASVAMGI